MLEDGIINLNVTPEVRQLDLNNAFVLQGLSLPAFLTRRTITSVRLHSGEHLVIGGLKQTDKVKVVKRIPVLGRIPLLGFFFSNTRVENLDHDLLVVVSPELVEAASSSLPSLPTDRPMK